MSNKNNMEMNNLQESAETIKGKGKGKRKSKKINLSPNNSKIILKLKEIINNYNKMVQIYKQSMLINNKVNSDSLNEEIYYKNLNKINFNKNLDMSLLKDFISVVYRSKYSHDKKSHIIMCAYLHLLIDDSTNPLSGGSDANGLSKSFLKEGENSNTEYELINPIKGASLNDLYVGIQDIMIEDLINNKVNKSLLIKKINSDKSIESHFNTLKYNGDYIKKLNDNFIENDLIKAFILYLLHNSFFYKDNEGKMLKLFLS